MTDMALRRVRADIEGNANRGPGLRAPRTPVESCGLAADARRVLEPLPAAAEGTAVSGKPGGEPGGPEAAERPGAYPSGGAEAAGARGVARQHERPAARCPAGTKAWAV